MGRGSGAAGDGSGPGLVDDGALGGAEQGGGAQGVVQSGALDLGRVDDAVLHQLRVTCMAILGPFAS